MPATPLVQRLLPDRYRRTCIAAFFGCFFLLGLTITRDYGLQSDDELQRMTGEISLLYVFRQLPTAVQQHLLPAHAAALIRQKSNLQLHTYHDRDYGVAFELPAAVLEQLLRLNDTRQKFLLRHYLVFLVCFGGVVAFYKLTEQRFGSWRVGLLGALWLILSPRQFADSFYNSKDAVFMALFTMAATTAVYWLRRPTWRRALLHAVACAIAIDVRLMAVLVPAATIGLAALRVASDEYVAWRRTAASAGFYIAALLLLVIIGWPFLWEAPIPNFLAAWHAMSHFRAYGELLYGGQLVSLRALPWHYVPRWITLTEPIEYLVLYLIGLIVIVASQLRKRSLVFVAQEWQDLLFLGLSIAPVIAVVSLHAVLYHGWRQLYFLHPMLLLVALRGLVALWQRPLAPARPWRIWRPALALIVAASLGMTATQMVRLHPLQNVYFNALSPKPVEKYYETDYWLLSLRPALEWIAQHDARSHIRVSTTFDRAGKGYSFPGYMLLENWLILPPAIQNRLALVEYKTPADYVIILPHFHQGPVPYTRPVYRLQAGSAHLLSIYRLH